MVQAKKTSRKPPEDTSLDSSSVCDIIDHNGEVIVLRQSLLDCQSRLRSAGFVPARLTQHLWVRSKDGAVSDYRRVVSHDPSRQSPGAD